MPPSAAEFTRCVYTAVVDGVEWREYLHDNGDLDYGYRFIWSRAGKLSAARGQARIPSLTIANELIEKAVEEGWGNVGEASISVSLDDN